MDLITFFFLLPLLAIRSWLALLMKSLASLYTFWVGLNFLYKLSLTFLLFQIFFSIKPWVHYEITFNEKVEFISISSKINLYLFFLEMIHLYVLLFLPKYKGMKLLVSSQTALFILFNSGLLFPNPVITDIQNPGDYGFSSTIYFYGLFTYMNLIVSIRLWIRFNQKVEDLNVTAS